jgi:hypothetical protein
VLQTYFASYVFQKLYLVLFVLTMFTSWGFLSSIQDFHEAFAPKLEGCCSIKQFQKLIFPFSLVSIKRQKLVIGFTKRMKPGFQLGV